MSVEDPLSIAQRGLEKLLRNSPAVKRATQLKIKNIDGFTQTRATKQQDVNSETDLPELRLVPIGGPMNVNFASNLTMLDYALSLQLNTGDLRVTEKLAPVLFAIYAVCAEAVKGSGLVDLTWEGYDFLKNITLSAATIGESDPSQNRGIVGFTAICDLTLHMNFPTTMLIAWNQ